MICFCGWWEGMVTRVGDGGDRVTHVNLSLKYFPNFALTWREVWGIKGT